jgi:hypothetical protein
MAVGGSPTLLQDNTKYWGSNIWAGSLLIVSIGGQRYFNPITGNTTNQITFPALPSGIQISQGCPYVICGGPASLMLDVPLSTRASQTTMAALLVKLDVALSSRGSQVTLASVLSQLDVALSSRASQVTLASVLAQLDVPLSTIASQATAASILSGLASVYGQLDVALSTRASQTTVASILSQLNLTATALAHYVRWNIPREPVWVDGAEVTAPAAGATLIQQAVSAALTGRLYGIHIAADEGNQFQILVDTAVIKRYVLGAAGTIEIILANPIIDAIAGGSIISIQNVSIGTGTNVYQASLLYDEG